MASPASRKAERLPLAETSGALEGADGARFVTLRDAQGKRGSLEIVYGPDMRNDPDQWPDFKHIDVPLDIIAGDFTDQGFDVTVRQSSTLTFPYSVWRKSITAGSTVSLPAVNSTMAPFYLVVVQ